ncbi:conserved domain protein [Heliomicrobium modesticaldum Ice1]|uniref:Conserved domain protein n=2 Tax=Heliomicrobium modesticaldum TaxID=35701 RepID=B0TBP2_HELMI|nr:conserved domain protein [Heliomicrobium modesticaldum Ice1]
MLVFRRSRSPDKTLWEGTLLERVQQILDHPRFIECLSRNEEKEASRRFCRHDMTHLLDVARIAYILALENPTAFDTFARAIGHPERGQATKEVVYGAALLHDMGKWKQYEDGEDHAEVGARLCLGVLGECGYSQSEIDVIAEAIVNHRKKGKNRSDTFLGRILALADGYSRLCCNCGEKTDCRWRLKQERIIY